MKPSTINILTSLELTAVQWQGVMQAFASEAEGTMAVQSVSSGAERTARWRDRHKSSQVTSQIVTSDVTVTEKESFPHTPFKENNNSNINVGVIPPIIPPSKKTVTSDFDAFWEAYPKREGGRDKQAAIKAFTARSRGVSSQIIIDGAARYAAYCESTGKTNTPFVRLARSWLNANGWEEDYSHANPNQHRSKSAATELLERFLGG